MTGAMIVASFLFGLMTRLGVSERRMWRFLGLTGGIVNEEKPHE